MTLKELIDKEDYTIGKIVKLSGACYAAVHKALADGASRSPKLLKWCEENGIQLKLNDSIYKPPQSKPVPPPKDPLLTHMVKQKRGLTPVHAGDYLRFEQWAKSNGIKVSVDRENFYRRIYSYEVIG